MRLKNSRARANHHVRTALTLTIGVLGSVTAGAQTLDKVVVSATRVEQSSFDAPAAIQSVDRDTIEGAGPQVNLSESLNRVPGLTILNRQNYAQDLQVSIRGFGARSAFGIRGIRLLIDGIPATTPDGQGQGSSISLTSTERIEVLRGPLALMYGNSSGGVIQAFTREAPEQPEFSAQAYGGSYGLTRTDWQYAGHAGQVGIVADYGTFNTDGFRANSKTERKQFNGKLSFDPSAATHVNVVFNRFDMPLAQDPLGLTAAQLAANPEQAGTNAVSRGVRKVVLQNQLGSSLTQKLDGDSSLTSRAYYGTRDNTQFQTGLATSTGGWVGLERSYYGAGLQFNQRTQLAAHTVQWAAGVEFDHSLEKRQGGAAALGEKTSTTRNEDNQAENRDAFVQATTTLTDRIALVTGLRSSRVQLTSVDHYLSDGNGSGSVNFQAVNPVLGLSVRALEHLNLYANYGKGFESPTLAEVAYKGAGTPAFNTAVNASHSEHFEVGAKWAIAPQSRLDFTLYQITSKDEIVVASSSGGNSTYKNAPGTQRSGWELSATHEITPNLRASLAASGIDASYSQAFTSGTTKVAAGNKIPGIPDGFVFAQLLWSSARLSAVQAAGSSPGTLVGVEVTHAGKLFANDVNTAFADGATTLNAKLSQSWTLANSVLTVYGRVDNLANKHYVGSVIVNQAASQFYEPAPGRNWTIGLRLVVPM